MALPTLDNTWQYNVNQAVPMQASIIATGQRAMKAIKDSLIGFASSPWTVQGSSNAASAGMDSVDRWGADTDLVWANSGGAHSWIVLRQPGVNTSGTFELCLDLNVTSASPTRCTFVISHSAGFTGGTTTARPTATDEMVMPSNGTGWGVFSTNVNYVLHVWQTTDGQITYVVLHYANTPTMFWMFARAKNPVTGWAHPFVAVMESETTTGSGASTTVDSLDLSYFSTAESIMRSYGSAPMAVQMTSESTTGAMLTESALFTAPNDYNGEYPMYPIGLMSLTPSHRGRHGQLSDLWIGLDVLAEGDTYPNDTSRQFVQFGTFIFPWNGSVPVTT